MVAFIFFFVLVFSVKRGETELQANLELKQQRFALDSGIMGKVNNA